MISVIIPSYNNPKYLDFCISSAVTHQKNENEIIAVIDGNPELYVDVEKKWNGLVKWVIFEENVGLPRALNHGVYNATSGTLDSS